MLEHQSDIIYALFTSNNKVFFQWHMSKLVLEMNKCQDFCFHSIRFSFILTLFTLILVW